MVAFALLPDVTSAADLELPDQDRKVDKNKKLATHGREERIEFITSSRSRLNCVVKLLSGYVAAPMGGPRDKTWFSPNVAVEYLASYPLSFLGYLSCRRARTFNLRRVVRRRWKVCSLERRHGSS